MLQPAPENLDASIFVRHGTFLSVEEIAGSVDAADFKVHNIFRDDKAVHDSSQTVILATTPKAGLRG